MKIGMPILFEYNSVEDNLILANKLGLDFVELNLNFNYCRKDIEKVDLEYLLKKYSLKATLHFFDETDFASYDEVVNAYIILLKKYIELSKNYVSIVNFHNNPGPVVTISGVKNYIYDKEYKDYITKLIKNYKSVETYLSSYGIQMVIENVDGLEGITFINNSFDSLYKSGFSFNLDIGHDCLNNFDFYNLSLENNIKFKEMHFHDSDGNKCHLELGKGTMDLRKFKELASSSDSWTLLEVKSSKDLINSVSYFKNL